MRKLFASLLLLCGCVLVAWAQTRTYSDNASNTFVFGLDSYFFGSAGSLDFTVAGSPVRVSLEGGDVTADGVVLESGNAQTVIGIHDFTGNHEPELMVARRYDATVSAAVYRLEDGRWQLIGQMVAADAREIRVFRQVVTIRSGDTLQTWTWHKTQFDYKSNK